MIHRISRVLGGAGVCGLGVFGVRIYWMAAGPRTGRIFQVLPYAAQSDIWADFRTRPDLGVAIGMRREIGRSGGRRRALGRAGERGVGGVARGPRRGGWWGQIVRVWALSGERLDGGVGR